MKLYCHACKQTLIRVKASLKRHMTKRGYKTFCEIAGKLVYLKEIK